MKYLARITCRERDYSNSLFPKPNRLKEYGQDCDTMDEAAGFLRYTVALFGSEKMSVNGKEITVADLYQKEKARLTQRRLFVDNEQILKDSAERAEMRFLTNDSMASVVESDPLVAAIAERFWRCNELSALQSAAYAQIAANVVRNNTQFILLHERKI